MDPGSITYPILIKLFYCNLSFITIDGDLALRSFVKGKEIISKTLIMNFLSLKILLMALILILWPLNMQRMCLFFLRILIFSPTRQLTQNGLNLYRKLLHTLLDKTVYSRNCSCELVSNAYLILMWKVAINKTIDYASLILSNMRFYSLQYKNIALASANLTLVFDHFNLLSDLEEVEYTSPPSLSNNILPPPIETLK